MLTEKPKHEEATMQSPVAKSPRKTGYLVSAVIVLCGLGAIVVMNGQAKNQAPPSDQAASTDTVVVSTVGQRVAQIRTATVDLASLEDKVAATGLVAYPGDTSVKVAPRVTGRVQDVYVQVGDKVTAGQPIALIVSPDAATARSSEEQNEANLRLAQATLQRTERQFQLGTPEVTSAQATYDQAAANAVFSKNALDKIREQSKIGGFTQQPLETALSAVATDQSSLVQSQADLATAQRAYDRMVKLVGIGVNSQSDLDGAQNTLAHAQANVDANQKVLDLANEALTRERTAYKTNLYSDQALLTAESNYRQALLQKDASDRALQIAKAAVLADLQQAQDGYTNAVSAEESSHAATSLLGSIDNTGDVTITAPISGVVVERDVNPGQMVDQSQMTPWQLMVISASSDVWVNGDVYEKDLAAVHPGQAVAISVDAYPDRTFAGAVVRISPAINPTTRAVSVRAVIPNTGGLLKDGMFAEMTIHTGQSKQAPVIPVDAVQHDADTEYVYVESGQGTYVRRNVQLGIEKDGRYAVTAGLTPGEHVVTQGALLLGGQVEND